MGIILITWSDNDFPRDYRHRLYASLIIHIPAIKQQKISAIIAPAHKPFGKLNYINPLKSAIINANFFQKIALCMHFNVENRINFKMNLLYSKGIFSQLCYI